VSDEIFSRRSDPDDIDRRLLGLLERDARRSLVALARDLGISRQATQARLTRLERCGIILGYGVRLAPGVPGGIEALLALKISVRPCSRVLLPLGRWPEVLGGWSVAGQAADAFVRVRVRDTAALADLSARIGALPGVESFDIFPVLADIESLAGQTYI
jgi:DNA-binding Lrp family transcriptional regulator